MNMVVVLVMLPTMVNWHDDDVDMMMVLT